MDANDRTLRYLRERASLPVFPVQHYAGEEPAAPPPFDADWIHTTNVASAIVSEGWRPDAIKNTIYGAAVYLARSRWSLYVNQPKYEEIRVRLVLEPSECMVSFGSKSGGTGCTTNHLIWYLQEQGVVAGKNAGPGTSTQNQRIKNHFLEAGIKAIHFVEEQTPVVAVFDPSSMRVVRS